MYHMHYLIWSFHQNMVIWRDGGLEYFRKQLDKMKKKAHVAFIDSKNWKRDEIIKF